MASYKKNVDDITQMFGAGGVHKIAKLLDMAAKQSGLTPEQFSKALDAIEEHLGPALEFGGLTEDRFWHGFHDHANRVAQDEAPDPLRQPEQSANNPPIEPAGPAPKPLSTEKAKRLELIKTPGTPEFQLWQSGDQKLSDEFVQLNVEMNPTPVELS
jgi:hypothetical protein